MRKDDQSVLNWIKEIQKLHGKVVKQGNHWEAIVKEEVVPALAIWITEPESKVIMSEIHRKDLHNTYTSWETLTRSMSLEDLRKLVQGIETKLWPKTFKCLRHKEALAKTLVPYSQLQAAVAEAIEKGKRVADELKRKLTEANKKITHLEKRTKILKREKDEATGSASAPLAHVRNTRIPGAYGVAPKGACQLCLDAGLGIRMHATNKCDPAKRKAAVETKERKASAKANAKPKGGASKKTESTTTSKAKAKAVPGHPVPEGLNVCYQVIANRKHPLGSYSSDLCAICKWEDVAPKGCRHPQETCFRRKGGPLKDITHPAKRTTKSMEMSNKLLKERKKQKAATRAAKAKAKAKKSVGFTSRVKATNKKKLLEEAMARGIPPGKRTDEELKQLNNDDWSEPSSTFSTRYILNKEVKKTGKLTPDELDMLMPSFHRNDKRQVDFTKKKFQSESGEHASAPRLP